MISNSYQTVFHSGPTATFARPPASATATDAFALMGNYYGTAPYLTTYLEGLSAALDAGLSLEYTPGYYYGQAAEPGAVWSETPHTVFVFLGQTGVFEGEEGDAIGSPLNGDRSSLSLPSIQLDCLRKLCKDRDRKWPKVVTVVTGGSPVDLSEVMALSDRILEQEHIAYSEAVALFCAGRLKIEGRHVRILPQK